MIKAYISLILLMGCTQLFSQTTWCPSGAKWEYEFVNFGSSGKYLYEYLGDTILEDINVKILKKTTVYSFSFSGDTTPVIDSVYTYSKGDKVYFYNWRGTSVDLIYDFGVSKGDTIHGIPVTKETLWLFDCLDVRGYDGAKVGQCFSLSLGTVYERIGSLKGMGFTGVIDCMSDQGDVDLIKYEDEDFIFTNGSEIQFLCPLDVQVSKSEELTFYPNPVERTITFESHFDVISIYNQYGALMFQGDNVEELSVNDLLPGVYTLKGLKGNKERISKFIKK